MWSVYFWPIILDFQVFCCHLSKNAKPFFFFFFYFQTTTTTTTSIKSLFFFPFLVRSKGSVERQRMKTIRTLQQGQKKKKKKKRGNQKNRRVEFEAIAKHFAFLVWYGHKPEYVLEWHNSHGLWPFSEFLSFSQRLRISQNLSDSDYLWVSEMLRSRVHGFY